jgi:RHS repeat-associated protein
MIACKHMDPLVGIDTHITLIPSPAGPIPTPLPNPYVGMVFDPMDYVPFLGATVKINGLPRGIAGGSGQALPPHLPLAGPFAKPPSNESEIFMGSATVVADGSPQSFLALPVLSCQDIGMPAPPRPNKKSEAKSLMLPTTVVLCVPMGPPVLIGGPPTISMMAMAMKGIMAGLKKLRGIMKASEKMAALSAKLRAMAAKLCKALGLGPNALAAMEKAICTVTGHPVDVANGRVFTEQTDFAMAGPLPLVWQRTWYSTSTYRGPLGHGWHHAYDVCLHVTDEVLLLRAADGRHLALPPLADGESFFDRKEKLTLRRIGNTYSVRRAGLTHVFSGDGQDRRPVRVEDDLGNRIALLHDSAGRLTSVVDSGGRSFELQYGRDGLLMQVEGPDPDHPLRKVVLVRYDYDPHGNLIYAHDALGQTTRYEYSGHLLAREVNRNGLAFYFEYDGKDEKDKKDEKPRCVHTWGDAGIYDHKLTYRSGVTVVESSLGQKTTYHHRGGLVWKTVDALGGITLTERNEWNEIVSETDALGQVKESVRDGRGNLVLEKSPDGSAVTLTYDASDRPVSLRGAAGGEWRWSYDQAGRMVERTDALGQRTLFRWSGARLLGVTDPSGHETLLDYDSAGNLSVLRTPDGAETRWSYDGLGRCVRVQDPGGNIEARQFDILGRVVRVQEPDGSVRELSYDGEGNVARAKDQHYDVAFKYGGMNRLLTRTQAGATVRFAYDTEEQLIAIYNEAGLVYRFALGPTGEVSEEYGFDGLHRKYERDKAGRVHRVLRPAGLATEYAYDGANRVLGLKHTDAQGNVLGEEKYVYGKDGELVAADNGTCAVKLDRDLLGRVVKEHQGGDTVESEYGPLGLRSRMKTSRGHVLEIERSVVGDVLALRAGGGPALAPASDAKSDDQVPTWETRFTRDQLGLEIERHLPGGVRSVWQRDKLGRALKHEIWSGKKLLGAKSYTWEPNNRLKMIVDALHGPARYGHDGMGNLAAVVYGDSKIDLRMPDAVGNLFRSNDRRDRTYGPAGQLLESLTKEGITRYSYDPEGNLTSKVLPDGSTWKYAWNAAGMLAKVIRPDGQEVTFGYDALGRRVWKKFKGKTTKWIWDGNVPVHEWVELDPGTLATPAPEMLAEADDAGLRQRAVNLSKRAAQGPPPAATEHGSADQPITWVFDPESFAPAAKLTSTQHYAIITDHLGTPSAMVDADGRASWSADLGIYGELRHVVGDKQACPFRWPGQYEDEETGLYYNRFRYYDPESGEYVSQDPIGLAGKNPGFHAYARDPNIFTDAFGLSCGSHSVYTLKDKAGNIVYVGITSRSPRERMLEHLRDGKAFHHMEVVAEGLGRTEARDIEGSALRHMSSEPLQNSRRLDGNFFHSYGDPPGGNRTLLSPGQTSSVLNNGLFSIFR